MACEVTRFSHGGGCGLPAGRAVGRPRVLLLLRSHQTQLHRAKRRETHEQLPNHVCRCGHAPHRQGRGLPPGRHPAATRPPPGGSPLGGPDLHGSFRWGGGVPSRRWCGRRLLLACQLPGGFVADACSNPAGGQATANRDHRQGHVPPRCSPGQCCACCRLAGMHGHCWCIALRVAVAACTGGIRAFYRGFSAAILRSFPANAVVFLGLEWTLKFLGYSSF